MKKQHITLMVSIFLTLIQAENTPAQTMTLDECMAYAVEHSTSVGQKQLDLSSRKADYNEAVATIFPDISGSISAVSNFGRSVDPGTNAYTNVTTFNNSYGLSGSMILFDGLQSINAIKAAKVARKQGYTELQIARDETAIETMNAYMNVVYYTEAVEIAREQLNAARTTLQQVKKLHELGRKSAADVAEIESQEANYDYLLTTQENNLALAIIKLHEAMNYPQDETLTIETHLSHDEINLTSTFDETINYALQYNPQIVRAQQNTRYMKLLYEKAKGAVSPTLYLYGGYNTNFFIDMENREIYDDFSSQFCNNRGAYIQMSLSIPIFTGLNRTSGKQRAKNAWQSAQLQQSATEREISSEVAQTYREMQGYGKQYYQGEKKVKAAQLAYDGAAKKFENGLISALDLHTAANTLLQAKSDRLQARLQHIIKTRMVEYYNGKPLYNSK